MVSAFIRDLARLFTPYFGQQEVAEPLALPEDYRCFATHRQGTWRGGDSDGLYLYGVQAVLAETAYECRSYAENRPPGAGMWIIFGQWSDRHDLMLCCDRQLPLFGSVIDFHDDHPWFVGNLYRAPVAFPEPDFADFLRAFPNRRT